MTAPVQKSVSLPLAEAAQMANGAVQLYLRGSLGLTEQQGELLLLLTPTQAEQVVRVLTGILGQRPRAARPAPLLRK